MAGPFSIFRKNRKVMMATLTILCMFGFVILPVYMMGVGGRSGTDPVMATSKYGNITVSTLQELRYRRQRMLGVMAEIFQKSGYPANYAGLRAEAMLGPATDEAVVNSWLLAHHASEIGMTISREFINGYLVQITENRVKVADIHDALKRANMSEIEFFAIMHEELATINLFGMFHFSLEAATPIQRWEYFNRIKKQAVIEAAAVPVADYIDRISDPTDADLKTFFEKHKDTYALPDSPEPGFREPRKIKLQYIKADFKKFTDRVTDEEVLARYEKLKQENEPGGQTDGAAGQPADGTEEKPAATDDAKAPEQGQEPTATPEQPKTTEEPKTPETTPPTDGDAKQPDGSSSTQRRSPFMLTALVEEKATEPGEAATTASETNPPATTDGAVNPADATTANEPAADAAIAETPKADETQAGPPDAIKNYIRKQIAGERIMKVFETISGQVELRGAEWSKYAAAQVKGEHVAEPAKFDADALAKENDMTAGETGLVSQFALQGDAIGGILVRNQQPLWQIAFSSLSDYRPDIATDHAGNVFMCWKTEEKKEQVRKWEEPGVRDAVLRAWKMIQARDLATEAAKKLADDARKANDSLKQIFADRPDIVVATPEPFSWLTFGQVPIGSSGSTPGALRLGEVSGVNMAGQEFMEIVFGLKPGEIAVAMNAPKTVAYVIRLMETKPSSEVRWSEFKVDDFSKYELVAGDNRREIRLAWFDELKRSANLQWTAAYAERKAAQKDPTAEEE